MKKTLLLALLIAGLCLNVKAQHVYPEVYDHCYLDQFDFETDQIIAKIDSKTLIKTITRGWDKKTLNKAEGSLGLQILVDRRGNSCLMSVRNDTNMKLKKLNLNKNINDNLKWERLSNKISTIILLEFKDGEISMKRLGTLDKVKLLEIKGT